RSGRAFAPRRSATLRAGPGRSGRSGSPSSPSAERAPPPARAALRRDAAARSPSGPRGAVRRRPPRRPSPPASRGSASSPCRSGGRSRPKPMRPLSSKRGPRASREDARRAQRAKVPGSTGLALGRQGGSRLRGDDESAGSASGRTRGYGSLLDPRGRERGAVTRRHGQGPVPDTRPASGRGGAHELPRRAPLNLPLLAVRLPAYVHLLRDGPDAFSPQPDRVGDP